MRETDFTTPSMSYHSSSGVWASSKNYSDSPHSLTLCHAGLRRVFGEVVNKRCWIRLRVTTQEHPDAIPIQKSRYPDCFWVESTREQIWSPHSSHYNDMIEDGAVVWVSVERRCKTHNKAKTPSLGTRVLRFFAKIAGQGERLST